MTDTELNARLEEIEHAGEDRCGCPSSASQNIEWLIETVRRLQREKGEMEKTCESLTKRIWWWEDKWTKLKEAK